MKKTTQVLAVLLAISIATPTHPITINTWRGLTCFGAVAGAVIGAKIYTKIFDGNDDRTTIKSACTGAVVGGLAFACWLYGYRPDARLAQARSLTLSAMQENHLEAFMNAENAQQEPNAISIERAACQHFRQYPMVYAERNMEQATQKLIQARQLCTDAAEDIAHDDEELMVSHENMNTLTSGLLIHSRDFGTQLRVHPRYVTELANERRERHEERKVTAKESMVKALNKKPEVNIVIQQENQRRHRNHHRHNHN